MAFMAAEIIRLVISKSKRAAARREYMTRIWLSLVLVIAAITAFKSFVPLLTFFRQEVIPHLRDLTLAVLNTQPMLFLLLNSIVFAVLAPSGLFNDCKPPLDPPESTWSTQSTQSTAPEVADPHEVKQIYAADPATEKPKEEEVSPIRAKVKRAKRMQKSQSATHLVKQQIAVGVEAGRPESARNRADSLKDEDFKQLIDSYIAHAREQMIKQEREYGASSAAARSRA